MNDSAFIPLIGSALRSAGADWPKPVAAAIANRDKLAAAAAKIPTGTPADLMAACAAALLDGRDPLTDVDVSRMVAASVLGGVHGGDLAYGVQRAADARIGAAIAEHVDVILGDLKRAVDEAGVTLARAHEILGEIDLGEAALILKLGPAAATAWTEAREAQQRIRVIDNGWFAIGNLTGAVSTSTSQTNRLADVSIEQYEQLGYKAEPWAIARAGATIDWATRDSIKERVQRLAAERAQREQRGASAFGDEFRRTHGTGQPKASIA